MSLEALQLLTFPVNVWSPLGYSTEELNQEFVHMQMLSLPAHINSKQMGRRVPLYVTESAPHYSVMCHITTFRSTTDHIYDGGPIILYYLPLCYNCLQYSVQ
jgi:hypothetical protein